MAVPKSIHDAKGLWKGTSKLNLTHLPSDKRVTESISKLNVETDEQGHFATVTYDWHHEGTRQEGTILICESVESNKIQFGWVDSWHQNFAVMHLDGIHGTGQTVKATGSYSAGKEMWGWTIELDLHMDQLTMNMENVSPLSEAEWAVKATYKRG